MEQNSKMWSAMPWLWREKLCLAHSKHLKSSSDLLAPKPTQLFSASITIRKFHISWKRTSGLFGRGYDVVILLCKSVLICIWIKIHQLDMSKTNWSTSLLVFSMPWFFPLILLTLPKSPSACKIFTKPLPWDNQVKKLDPLILFRLVQTHQEKYWQHLHQIRPWNIFNPPKPSQPATTSSPTSFQPPSCTCGEKVAASPS